MVLGHEGEEPASAERVSGVSGFDVEVLQALAHLHVLGSAGVLPETRVILKPVSKHGRILPIKF